MITVSIIMTTYGQEHYIAQAIEGVLMQECDFKVELILAEDNSPDNTQKVVEKLLQKHPKKDWVNYTRHAKNKGMIANGLWALNQCKGKYIALCEGDDYWTDPLKLKKQVEFLDNHKDYGLVFTDFNIYYNDAAIFRKDIFKKGLMPLYYTFEEHLLNAGFLAPCTWLCRKELVPNITNDCVDGSYYWMLHVMANSKIKFLEDTTTVYRVLKESASRSLGKEFSFKFSKGIFLIQKSFINEYRVNSILKNKIYGKKYRSLSPLASVLNENIFILEAKEFWKKHRISVREDIYYLLILIGIFKPVFKFLYWLKYKMIFFLNFKFLFKRNIWSVPFSKKSNLL